MFDKMFDSRILCALIAGIWICLSVIEFIGLGSHIDTTNPQSVAKQGLMFTFASVVATFWFVVLFEPSFLKLHRRVVILFCVFQCVYFVMYFMSNQWINSDSKISFTDTNDWGKSKLILSIVAILFLVYTLSLAILDKNVYSMSVTLTVAPSPPSPPSPSSSVFNESSNPFAPTPQKKK